MYKNESRDIRFVGQAEIKFQRYRRQDKNSRTRSESKLGDGVRTERKYPYSIKTENYPGSRYGIRVSRGSLSSLILFLKPSGLTQSLGGFSHENEMFGTLLSFRISYLNLSLLFAHCDFTTLDLLVWAPISGSVDFMTPHM